MDGSSPTAKPSYNCCGERRLFIIVRGTRASYRGVELVGGRWALPLHPRTGQLEYSQSLIFAMFLGLPPPSRVRRRLSGSKPLGRGGPRLGGLQVHNYSTLHCLGAGLHRQPPRRVLRRLGGATPLSNLRTATHVQGDRAVCTITCLPPCNVFGLASACYLEVVFRGGWMAQVQRPDLCTAAAVQTGRPEYSQFSTLQSFGAGFRQLPPSRVPRQRLPGNRPPNFRTAVVFKDRAA